MLSKTKYEQTMQNEINSVVTILEDIQVSPIVE